MLEIIGWAFFTIALGTGISMFFVYLEKKLEDKSK